MKERCECELFVEKYFGLPDSANELSEIHTDFGQLVNMLVMFRDNERNEMKDLLTVLTDRDRRPPYYSIAFDKARKIISKTNP